MKYEKRTNKDGSSYYRFVWYDAKTKKRISLTREEIKERFGRDILTEEEAKKFLPTLNAEFEGEKVRIQRRLAWEKEFYNFTSLVEQYEKKQRQSAPNSYKNNLSYLKHYVLPFFLSEKKLNNIELWADHFEDYREWLEKTATLIRGNRPLSYAGKNHAIKTLNTFLSHLFRQKLLKREVSCETFPEYLCKTRDLDDVIEPHEIKAVDEQLIALGYRTEADFFRFLYVSGMRFSEGLAVSLADLFQGEMENTVLNKKLKDYDLEYHGYVVADSQFDGKNGNEVKRAPFKGKKEISEKHARTIPIIDRDLWNRLIDRAGTQFARYKNGEGSSNKRDYLLFDGIDDTTATERLKEAFASTKLKYRSWHCLRHSRATMLIGQTGDFMLGRMWLGHTTMKVFERYNHIWQAMIRRAKQKKDLGMEFGLKKV